MSFPGYFLLSFYTVVPVQLLLSSLLLPLHPFLHHSFFHPRDEEEEEEDEEEEEEEGEEEEEDDEADWESFPVAEASRQGGTRRYSRWEGLFLTRQYVPPPSPLVDVPLPWSCVFLVEPLM